MVTERESVEKFLSENLGVEIILNLVNGHGMRLKQVAPEKKAKRSSAKKDCIKRKKIIKRMQFCCFFTFIKSIRKSKRN